MSETKQLAPGITMNWQVMSGTPCIQGTRIPPMCIMGYFMTGRSVKWIAKDYHLTTAAVENAIRYEYGLKLTGKRRPRARKPRGATREGR